MTPRPSILFVNQHYWPDVAATGQVLSDLAEYLVGAGYEVEVLCSRGGYQGGKVDAPSREIRRGVRVTRVPSPGFGRRRHRGRFVDYGTFLAQVAARLAVGRQRDLVVLLTTPSMLPVSGWIAGRLRGRPYAIVRRRRGFAIVIVSISASLTPASRSRGRNVSNRYV